MVFSECMAGSPRNTCRSRIATILTLFLLVLSGCAGDVPQSIKQSLSIVAPHKINFTELEYYAKRSRSAYDSVQDIRKDYPHVTRAVTVESVDVRYFVETDLANRTHTLTIRGTAEKPNIWEDIETALIPDSILGIPLHRGFQRDAAAIYDDAAPYMRKDFRLRITGHSLGGAVAMILAAYYEKQGYSVERLVTFGQPKFSSRLPSEYVMSVATRVVNDLDVVPMVPPYSPARQYQHFAAEVILRDGPDYVYLDVHDADRLSIGDFWRNITDFSAKDHHMDGYLDNIQGKIANGSRQVPYLFKDKPES